MAVRYGSRELVINGGAETGPVAQDYSTNIVPAGWTTTGTFTGVAYGFGGPSDLNAADSLALQGGSGYFSGGTSAGVSTAVQKIDLTAYAARIDAGLVTLDLTAQLGGYDVQDDKAAILLTFYDAATAVVGTASLTGPVAGGRGGVSTLLDLGLTQALAAGVRSVEVTIVMTRAAGTYNDGYADNVSIHLDGLARGQVLVDASHDFRVDPIAASRGVSFVGLGDSVATFNANQFGAAGIALNGLVEGSAQVDTLGIFMQAGTTFSLASLGFAGWTGKDVVEIHGEALAERLTGTRVNDRIGMGAGNDTASGGAGSDTLDGGAGIDRLTGGLDADRFVLASRGADRDIITDFVSSADKFIVQVADFPAAAGLVAGTALGSAFLAHGLNTALGAEDRFIYNTSNGQLWFDADGTGALAGRLIATLTGVPVVAETDFLLV